MIRKYPLYNPTYDLVIKNLLYYDEGNLVLRPLCSALLGHEITKIEFLDREIDSKPENSPTFSDSLFVIDDNKAIVDLEMQRSAEDGIIGRFSFYQASAFHRYGKALLTRRKGGRSKSSDRYRDLVPSIVFVLCLFSSRSLKFSTRSLRDLISTGDFISTDENSDIYFEGQSTLTTDSRLQVTPSMLQSSYDNNGRSMMERNINEVYNLTQGFIQYIFMDSFKPEGENQKFLEDFIEIIKRINNFEKISHELWQRNSQWLPLLLKDGQSQMLLNKYEKNKVERIMVTHYKWFDEEIQRIKDEEIQRFKDEEIQKIKEESLERERKIREESQEEVRKVINYFSKLLNIPEEELTKQALS